MTETIQTLPAHDPATRRNLPADSQPVDPALLVGRNASISGFYLGRFMKLRPVVVQGAARELLARWAAGDFAPIVGATFALAEADTALRLVAERRSTGKVVLVP